MKCTHTRTYTQRRYRWIWREVKWFTCASIPIHTCMLTRLHTNCPKLYIPVLFPPAPHAPWSQGWRNLSADGDTLSTFASARQFRPHHKLRQCRVTNTKQGQHTHPQFKCDHIIIMQSITLIHFCINHVHFLIGKTMILLVLLLVLDKVFLFRVQKFILGFFLVKD